jgi:DMSO reductase family type II enzyme heme b subunit
MRHALPWLFGSLAISLLLVGSCRSTRATPPGETGMPVKISSMRGEERLARGEELFDTHCTVCHGLEGGGRGAASPYLFPAARDFGEGRFRLVSTTNGVPLDLDLVDTLRRGMPGSSMPAWNWLPEEDLWCLASYVRQLTEERMAARLQAEAFDEGAELSSASALALAHERMTPAERIVPIPAAAGAEALARGEKLYVQNCSSCHGKDGTGERDPRWNEDGSLNWARDFTAGFMKGGASAQEIAWRVQAGLPGSAMPPTVFNDPADVAAVVAYVRELIPTGAEFALVQRRESLRARQVDDAPEHPDAPRWSKSDRIQFELAPLWWRDDSVTRATARALHDGEDIAILISWKDATGALNLFSDVNRSDGVALQFSNADAPPLFGMGTEQHETTIWHWKSLRISDVAGATDLLQPSPHLTDPGEIGEVRADAPIYRQLEGVPAVSSRVDEFDVSGIETARSAERGASRVEVVPLWRDGEWHVLFRRQLAPADCSEITFHSRTTLQFACAIWNGDAGDEGAQKSIGIWQELAIE